MSDLNWPPGFDRTPPHQRRGYPGGFKVSRRLAFDSIVEELEKMDAVNVDVQTAAPHTAKQPHQPYQDRDPEDPGVVVYFDREGQRYAVPCDRWDNLRDNARAIAKYLDAKRAIERYGVATVETEMSTQALPAGDDDVIVAGNGEAQEPHEILDVSPDAPPAVVKGAARSLKAQYHPDQPDGDREKFQQVQDAEEAMLEERAQTDGGESVQEPEPEEETWDARFDRSAGYLTFEALERCVILAVGHDEFEVAAGYADTLFFLSGQLPELWDDYDSVSAQFAEEDESVAAQNKEIVIAMRAVRQWAAANDHPVHEWFEQAQQAIDAEAEATGGEGDEQ